MPTEIPKWVGSVPHDAVEELREGMLEAADSIEETPFQKMESLTKKILQVPKDEIESKRRSRKR